MSNAIKVGQQHVVLARLSLWSSRQAVLHGEGGVCRRYYGHCVVVCVSRLVGKQNGWSGSRDGITRESPCVAAFDVNEGVTQMKWIVGSATEMGRASVWY